MMLWIYLHPRMTAEHLGLLPGMLSENDPLPAAKQFDKHYQHGGGWRPLRKFELRSDKSLKYPGDPALKPLAFTKLRDETIYLYEGEIVVIVQPDGSFEAARMD